MLPRGPGNKVPVTRRVRPRRGRQVARPARGKGDVRRLTASHNRIREAVILDRHRHRGLGVDTGRATAPPVAITTERGVQRDSRLGGEVLDGGMAHDTPRSITSRMSLTRQRLLRPTLMG
jgi:hypothetical protein